MRKREHPSPELLLRFLAGEVMLAEGRAVVRHLLKGCRECVALTRPIFQISDFPLRIVPTDAKPRDHRARRAPAEQPAR